MSKPMFDAEALISMFENATAKQGEQLRKATSDATMAALAGRELTLKNIRSALQQVAGAASMGAAKNLTAGIDPETLLDKAVSGMDDAMLKAVDANRVALQTLATQGADLRDKHLAKAMSDLEKIEDSIFDAVKKAASGAAGPVAAAWGPVMEKMQAAGTLSGSQAAQTAEQMAAQMAAQVQSTMRSTRAASMRAAQALAESYSAMVSGVLVGMADALQAGGAGTAAAAKKAKK
jgi:hypothetical protein